MTKKKAATKAAEDSELDISELEADLNAVFEKSRTKHLLARKLFYAAVENRLKEERDFFAGDVTKKAKEAAEIEATTRKGKTTDEEDLDETKVADDKELEDESTDGTSKKRKATNGTGGASKKAKSNEKGSSPKKSSPKKKATSSRRKKT